MWLQAHGLAQMMPDSVRRAGFEGEGLELGEALFEAIMRRESGLVFTVDDYDETWRRVANPDRRVTLSVPELLEELGRLGDEPRRATPTSRSCCPPGSAASHTANTIYRDPTWRKTDAEGALRITRTTPQRLGIVDGGRARLTTKRGQRRDRRRGHRHAAARLRHAAQRLRHSAIRTATAASGPRRARPNELTASEDRDWLAGTPHHKHVAARVEAA